MIEVRAQETALKELSIKGFIPSWLSGTLVRNGPVTVAIDGKTNEHWFDGLAMLHHFGLSDGKVHYTNRFLRSEAYDAVFEDHSLAYIGFSVDPCRSFFKRFMHLFISDDLFAIHNANVNVAKIAEAYVAMTEIPLPVIFDKETLATLGVLDFQDNLPKSDAWMSAHPHVVDEASMNYMVTFARKSSYKIYEVPDEAAVRKVIAEVSVEKPSYMHSFSVTDQYIILTEYPLIVNPLSMLLQSKPFIKNYEWDPDLGTTFTVIERATGKIVGRFPTRPFFAFHHVNAFEQNGKICIDIVTYKDATIITRGLFNIDSGKILKGDHYQTQLERFYVDLNEETITSETIYPHTIELPRINDKMDGRPYRYAYAMRFSDNMAERSELLYSESLCKIDTVTKKVSTWSKPNCSAGEPVFVPSPNPQSEDDGVILSVVLDRQKNTSYLLVLDAMMFTEIAWVEAPHAIAPGLHGNFFKNERLYENSDYSI
jgi:carotenoid cleavage dioxygenase-like enzyme